MRAYHRCRLKTARNLPTGKEISLAKSVRSRYSLQVTSVRVVVRTSSFGISQGGPAKWLVLHLALVFFARILYSSRFLTFAGISMESFMTSAHKDAASETLSVSRIPAELVSDRHFSDSSEDHVGNPDITRLIKLLNVSPELDANPGLVERTLARVKASHVRF
jgi:hypothetical protein